MTKREQLLLAAKIFQNRQYFEFHSIDSHKIENVDIEIIDQISDEFEHYNANKTNKITFTDKEVFLYKSNLNVIVPDVLYTHLEIKAIESSDNFQIILKNASPNDFIIAFQIAYNRIKFEEAHHEKSAKEIEDKLINEMLPFDIKQLD